MGELEGQYKSDTSLPPVQGVPFPGTTCLTEVSHPASTMHLPCSGLTAPSRCSHFSWKSAAGSAGGGEKESGGSIPPPQLVSLPPRPHVHQQIAKHLSFWSINHFSWGALQERAPSQWLHPEENVSPSLSHW